MGFKQFIRYFFLGNTSSNATVISATPPTNTSSIWLDISSDPAVWRTYSFVTNDWEIVKDEDINDEMLSVYQTWSSQKIQAMQGMEFTQSTLSDIWIINHELGRMPSVTCVDENNEEIIGRITYDSMQRIIIRFSEAVIGKAYLN
jgi:hypothetical protein